MKKRDIAIVFDNRVRPDTTGMYFKWGFERLGHNVTHLLPDQALTVGKCADLHIKIDDGIRAHNQWNEKMSPCAYYCIDTHYWDAKEWRPQVASQFDVTFCAQKDGVQFMINHGAVSGDGARIKWLPLAADEDLHTPEWMDPHTDVAKVNFLYTERKYDWSFVGNVGHADPDTPNKRMDYLDALLKEFPNGIISDYSFYKEMANIYGNSRVVFNTCINNDLNMRFWEGMCSGAVVLTEQVNDNGMEDLDLGGYYREYQDTESLLQMMHSIISNYDGYFCDVGRKARNKILQGHTYQHRCQSILDHFNL